TMSAIRHPCLIMGQCPSNFEGRNTHEPLNPKYSWNIVTHFTDQLCENPISSRQSVKFEV
ncbi:MAG: hypothetical protein BECKG1743D_GA0114223_107301, partial [Candidatus Kentron sp. G]